MKKYKWNKKKFITNILKLLSIGLVAFIFDIMFTVAFFEL